MSTPDIDAVIKALEMQFHHYENLLDQSIRNNEILAKTKEVYHDLRIISDKLQELKKLQKKE